MGGRGELVLYTRIRAKTKREREQLKKEINDIIDQSATAISVIALVDEPSPSAKPARKPAVKRKTKRRV
jgi:hypothetical protein